LSDETTIYVRPSTVQSFALCPARTLLRGEPGFNHYPNEALLFGTMMHWTIEHELTGESSTNREALDELENAFSKNVPDADTAGVLSMSVVTTQKQRQDLLDEVSKAFVLWKKEVKPNLPDEVPVIEEPLEMQLGTYRDYQIVLRGTPDAVYPNTEIIVDWKTAGRNWNDDKASGQLQRVGYPLMAAADKNWEISEFHYWVFDRSGEQWNLFKVPVGTPEAQAAFMENAFAVGVAQIENTSSYTPSGGGFKARGWNCSPKYCDAWSVCDGKFLVADGQAEEPALTLQERWS